MQRLKCKRCGKFYNELMVVDGEEICRDCYHKEKEQAIE